MTLHHAQRAGSLGGDHRDPFDRMLIEQLPIASVDAAFDPYAVNRIW